MDSAVAKALDEVLFGEGRPQAKTLTALSDLRARQLEGFLQRWLEAPLKRRRDVTTMLVELAEDSFEMFLDEVLKTILGDPDPVVRRMAIDGLWESNDFTVAERLMTLLATDDDASVREHAAITLGHFAFLGEMEELAEADAERVRDALLTAARDQGSPPEARRRAVEAVAFFANDPEVQRLISDSYAQPSVEMRASALYAMGRNCDARWSPTVLEALESDEPQLRFEAARAAGEIEERRAIPQLLELLGDEDMEVRLEAIDALGRIGGDQARTALIRLTDHEDERISEAAADALDEVMFADDPLLRKMQ